MTTLTSCNYQDISVTNLVEKKLKFGRKHGGLAVYVHSALVPGISMFVSLYVHSALAPDISKLPLSGSETIILKLKKEYFNLTRNIMLSFSYCAPAGSSYLTRTQIDPFADLEIKLADAAQDGELICFGDFNARTGTNIDYLNNEDNTDIPIIEDSYMTDTVATYPGGNRDLQTNQYGEELISLCRSLPLRICNGCKLGRRLIERACCTCVQQFSKVMPSTSAIWNDV